MPLVAPLVVGEVISPTAQTVLLNGLLPGIVIIAGGKTPPLRALMAWAILVFRGRTLASMWAGASRPYAR